MGDSRWSREDRAMVWFALGGIVLGVMVGTVIGILVGAGAFGTAIGISTGAAVGVGAWFLWRSKNRT